MPVTCETELINYKNELNVCTEHLNKELTNRIHISNKSNNNIKIGTSYMQTLETVLKIKGIMIIILFISFVLLVMKQAPITCNIRDIGNFETWFKCYPYVIPGILYLVAVIMVFKNTNYSAAYLNDATQTVTRQTTSTTSVPNNLDLIIYGCYIPAALIILCYAIYAYRK